MGDRIREEKERINYAIATQPTGVDRFLNNTADFLSEFRHMMPAVLMSTRVPILFGAGAAWEGANLAYDYAHNDQAGMYRSVFEPAGFALFDAAANPATYQFLGNAARRAGNYVYDRAISPAA